jgi:hypothetical protein
MQVKELGQPRGVGFAIVMSIVTLGIYSIYWICKTYSEVRRYRGQGVGGFGGFLLCFIFVGHFLLPAYIGRMQTEAGQRNTISGWTGLFIFIPYIGIFILMAKEQGTLNDFWASQAGGSATPAPAAAMVGDPA